jgi:hypothetical protein
MRREFDGKQIPAGANVRTASKRSSMKPLNSLRWIESKSVEKLTSQTKFLPLPGGEGRGEGERKYKPFIGRLKFYSSADGRTNHSARGSHGKISHRNHCRQPESR